MALNKRGDISITILVIGVFAVCAIAIISFILFSSRTQANSANMEIFENLTASIENYYFYINSGLSPAEAAQNIGAQLNGNQLILTVEQRTEPNIFGKSDLIVSVNYIVDLSK